VWISDHAVNRYRQRFQGARKPRKSRTRQYIRSQIQDDTRFMYRNADGSLSIVTGEFVAVMRQGVVTTVMTPSEQHERQIAVRPNPIEWKHRDKKGRSAANKR
jgi:hypothetical protein